MLSTDGILNDLIDVFEASHTMNYDGEPRVEKAAELRPLVYEAVLARDLSSCAERLRRLEEALQADTQLERRKKDELILKVGFAARYIEHVMRYTMC